MNDKQQVFVNEYLKCWNASEAARRAGYNGKSNVVGPRLLANVSIKAEITARIEELKMSADEVLIRLGDMARADMRDFIKPFEVGEKTIVMVDLGKALEEGKTHLIKKLKYNAQGGLEIELHDSQAALEKLGRHHGLFTDKVEHSGAVSALVVLPGKDGDQ